MTTQEICAKVWAYGEAFRDLGFVQCVCRVERDVLRRALTEEEQEAAERYWIDTEIARVRAGVRER